LSQNARSTSRRGGGRPGDHIGGRPVFVDTHAAVRPIVTSLLIGVLRRPLESANYTSREFAGTLAQLNLRQSVGRTGSCYDNAMAESFFAALKNERVHRTVYTTGTTPNAT
jgi:transposase InsO family protein